MQTGQVDFGKVVLRGLLFFAQGSRVLDSRGRREHVRRRKVGNKPQRNGFYNRDPSSFQATAILHPTFEPLELTNGKGIWNLADWEYLGTTFEIHSSIPSLLTTSK